MIHAHLGRQNHTMKFLFDFFPVLVFFIVYKVTDNIYHATAVLIAATIFQVGYTWFKQRRVERVHLVTLIFVVLLGRSEEHTSELQSRPHLVCRLLLEKKKTQNR